MKEAAVKAFEANEKTDFINKILAEYYIEGWVLIKTQYVPCTDKYGRLLLFFEREITVSPEQITVAVEEFRESLASLLD